jgi:hypothetical protein
MAGLLELRAVRRLWNAPYIATPHPQHAEWAIRAAEAGKHVATMSKLAIGTAGLLNYPQAAAVFITGPVARMCCWDIGYASAVCAIRWR